MQEVKKLASELLQKTKETLEALQKFNLELEAYKYEIPAYIRQGINLDEEEEEEEEKEEELISEDYPLGRMIEPYDIWKEENL